MRVWGHFKRSRYMPFANQTWQSNMAIKPNTSPFGLVVSDLEPNTPYGHQTWQYQDKIKKCRNMKVPIEGI